MIRPNRNMWSRSRFEGFQDTFASATGDIGSATGGADGPAPAPAPFAMSPAPAPFAMSQAPAPFAPNMAPTASANGATLTFLRDLMYRIDQESIALNTLPKQSDGSMDTTVIAKLNQLESMNAQIEDYVQKLTTNPPTITLADVPITQEAADNFLRSLGKPSATKGDYPALFTTNTTVTTAPAPASTSLGSLGGFDFTSMGDTQSLFKSIQDIKWRFELSYDPALSQKTDLLNRLESLEKRIMSYAKEGVAMPDTVRQVITRELDLLTTVIKGAKQPDPTPKYQPRQKSQQTRTSSSASYRQADGRTYSSSSVEHGDSYSLFDGVPQDSPDVRVRPGFVLTDEQIRRRGSAAAFNTQAVGGADYKKRAEDLCRQIRNANIGTPADFGCIENAGEVSANYSWKGNYAMVCNRLGDTWGSWYPEMFGCPKQDPDDRYNGNLL